MVEAANRSTFLSSNRCSKCVFSPFGEEFLAVNDLHDRFSVRGSKFCISFDPVADNAKHGLIWPQNIPVRRLARPPERTDRISRERSLWDFNTCGLVVSSKLSRKRDLLAVGFPFQKPGMAKPKQTKIFPGLYTKWKSN